MAAHRRQGRAARALLVAAALAAAPGCASVGPGGDEPLVQDPALVTGTLDNGFAYVIRRHATPPGRVSFWLHVSSGSLVETEETRGLAHYLEHMAFNGSANFPPGSLVPYFQSLGLSFGRDQNAFTGFDQTTYTLTLPDPREETLDQGLLYLSDVAFRLSLFPAEIESERQIILEEKRARAGAEQRVQEYVYERLAPGSTFGRRLPIGTEATIRSVGPKDFQEYYRRWYVPGNMTLIAVGDADPGLVATLIARRFADGPARPRPPNPAVGVPVAAASRAIVATDSELTRGEVSILRVEPPRGPITTVRARRRDLVEQIGLWAFNQRMAAEVALGQVAFLEASASVSEPGGALRLAGVEAAGRPEAWRAMLRDLGTALQRARRHGFTEREVGDARAALLARAEDAVQREATLPARTVLRQINGAVARREPVQSAAQRLDLLRRLLPGIAPVEVSRTFAAVFDATHGTFIAELPSGGDVPGEADLVALGRAALDVTPGPPTEVARAAGLLPVLPRGGAIVETTEHAATGVVSAWLANGVRVHHRFMAERANEVSVTITLAGGQIRETATTRGLTDAAARAWERPATSTLSSTQVRDLLTGKNVRLSARTGPDTLTLTVSGNPADLETGLQLAYLLLTDPHLEPAALEQWKEGQRQAIATRKTQPQGALVEALAEALYPADAARLQPLGVGQVQATTRDGAQAWLRTLIAEAPIEVAVVGDLARPRAFGLVERYLGSLPPRERIGDKTLGGLRSLPRPAGPIRVERGIDARTPQSVVLDGFFGADLRDVRDTRLLAVAARVLTTRMNRVIREERQLVYSIGAFSQPAVEYPGFGRFAAQAPTDPAKGQALAAAIEEMYAAFAADGPGEDEMTVARRQFANLLDTTFRDPEFWLGRLATLDYRGQSLDDVAEAPAAYQRLAAAEVREAFARYYRPESRFRLVITPR